MFFFGISFFFLVFTCVETHKLKKKNTNTEKNKTKQKNTKRVTFELNNEFLNMFEDYFARSREEKMKQVRPDLAYQIGATPDHKETPRNHCARVETLDPNHKFCIYLCLYVFVVLCVIYFCLSGKPTKTSLSRFGFFKIKCCEFA